MMRAQAVERIAKGRDVEGVTNEDTTDVEGDNGGTFAKDRREGVVPHPNPKLLDAVVGDEGRSIREHVVGSTRVRDDEARRAKGRWNVVGRLAGEELLHRCWEPKLVTR